MKSIFLLCLSYLLCIATYAQDTLWCLRTDTIDAKSYYGVTLANGMIGMTPSAEPLKTDLTLLAGVYDHYGRGRTAVITGVGREKKTVTAKNPLW